MPLLFYYSDTPTHDDFDGGWPSFRVERHQTSDFYS